MNMTDLFHRPGIQLTELYEYLVRLVRPSFELPFFQPYKFLYATRLAEIGFFKESLLYTEDIGRFLIKNAQKVGDHLKR